MEKIVDFNNIHIVLAPQKLRPLITIPNAVRFARIRTPHSPNPPFNPPL